METREGGQCVVCQCEVANGPGYVIQLGSQRASLCFGCSAERPLIVLIDELQRRMNLSLESAPLVISR